LLLTEWREELFTAVCLSTYVERTWILKGTALGKTKGTDNQ